jgi:RND family efflux transporter MFP subunit
VTKRQNWWLLGVAVTGGLALACAEPPAETTVAPVTVRARLGVAAAVERAERAEVRGRVVATQSAAVSARVMASVVAVKVQRGDEVAAGAVLVEIDPGTAAGQVAQATGALAQAQAAATLAGRQVERFEALARDNAASALELDLARADLARAEGAVEAARGAVSASRSIAGDTRVRAPFAGRVAEVLVEPGDLATPGRPLVQLEAAGERRFAAAVPESVVLALGDAVTVQIDQRPDLGLLEGRVVELAPGLDPGSFTRSVEVELATADLAVGAGGRLVVPRGTRSVVEVPSEAIVRRGGLDLVVVRDASGRASGRTVRLGAQSGGTTEVLAGLVGGETVLLGLGALPPAGALVEELPQ